MAFVVERDGARRSLDGHAARLSRSRTVGRHRIWAARIRPARASTVSSIQVRDALIEASRNRRADVESTLYALGRDDRPASDAEELRGPLGIARDVGRAGANWTVVRPADSGSRPILSINLGFMNLFPMPILDGGHLLFYGIEAARGGLSATGFKMEVSGWACSGFRTLMLFATWNDLHLQGVNVLPI